MRQASGGDDKAFSLTRGQASQKHWRYTLDGGKLLVGGNYLQLDPLLPMTVLDDAGRPGREIPLTDESEAILNNTLLIRTVTLPTLDVSVRNDGKWWFDYAVHFSVHDDERHKTFYFTDETGDEYAKRGGRAHHMLSYNSDAPSIVAIAGWVSEPIAYRPFFKQGIERGLRSSQCHALQHDAFGPSVWLGRGLSHRTSSAAVPSA